MLTTSLPFRINRVGVLLDVGLVGSLTNRKRERRGLPGFEGADPRVAAVPSEHPLGAVHLDPRVPRLDPLRDPDLQLGGPAHPDVHASLVRDVAVDVGPGRRAVQQQVDPQRAVGVA